MESDYSNIIANPEKENEESISESWAKLPKSILKTKLLSNHGAMALLNKLILEAEREDGYHNGLFMHAGEYLTTRPQLAKALIKQSELKHRKDSGVSMIRSWEKTLIKTGYITVERTPFHGVDMLLYKVINYSRNRPMNTPVNTLMNTPKSTPMNSTNTQEEQQVNSINTPEYRVKSKKEEKEYTHTLTQPGNKFSGPSLEEVKQACKEIAPHVDPQRFWNHMDNKNWWNGKYDWKEKLKQWEKGDSQKAKNPTTGNKQSKSRNKVNTGVPDYWIMPKEDSENEERQNSNLEGKTHEEILKMGLELQEKMKQKDIQYTQKISQEMFGEDYNPDDELPF